MTIDSGFVQLWKQHQALQAEADQAEEARLQEQATKAERERQELEAARQRRLEREEIESMSEEERDYYEKTNDPRKMLKDIYAQVRQAEESEFSARLTREYEDEIRNGRHQANIIQLARQHMREKSQAWQQDRDARELKAEAHAEDTVRMIHSLTDRGRAIMRDLLERQPSTIERVQSAKQAVRNQKIENLTAQYIQDAKAVRGKPWKLGAIKEQARANGVPVDSIDFTKEL